MKTALVLQLGRNKAGYLLLCGFAFGMYFWVLAMFMNFALFNQIHQAVGPSNFLEIAQLPHNISQERLDSVIASLGNISGVVEIQLLPEEDLQALLQPWFPEKVVTELLPLPFLIEITGSQTYDFDKAKLQAVLNEVSGASLMGPPAEPGTPLASPYGLLGALFIIIFAFTAGLISVVIFMVTRMSLLLHKETVSVLRLLGAADHFIVRQFQFSMVRTAVMGGVIGSLLAAGTVMAALLCARGFGIEWFLVDELITLFLVLVAVGVGTGLVLTWLLVPKVVSRHLLFLKKPRW
jgi:cell division protein FtsX